MANNSGSTITKGKGKAGKGKKTAAAQRPKETLSQRIARINRPGSTDFF
jgi:hypothetical protein